MTDVRYMANPYQVTLYVDMEQLTGTMGRMAFVQHFGPRLDGDGFLTRGDVQGYIEWLRTHPDKAPYGLLKGTAMKITRRWGGC